MSARVGLATVMLAACSAAPATDSLDTARAELGNACGPSPAAPRLRFQFDIIAELDRALLTLPEHNALLRYHHDVETWAACVEGRDPPPILSCDVVHCTDIQCPASDPGPCTCYWGEAFPILCSIPD